MNQDRDYSMYDIGGYDESERVQTILSTDVLKPKTFDVQKLGRLNIIKTSDGKEVQVVDAAVIHKMEQDFRVFQYSHREIHNKLNSAVQTIKQLTAKIEQLERNIERLSVDF
jgi:hypothetical protein